MEPSVKEESWRETFLMRLRNVSILNMIDRADRQVYKSISQFWLETAAVVHNVIIFFGGNSLYLKFNLTLKNVNILL